MNNIAGLSPYPRNGYDSYVLLKYTDSYEHQQGFLDGKLYFNTSDYFMLCNEKGRGDSTEGAAWTINPSKTGYLSANLRSFQDIAYIEVLDYSTQPEKYQPRYIFSYSPAINRYRKLISICTIYTSIGSNRVQDIDPRMKTEFGWYGVLILNATAFYERLEIGIRNHLGVERAQFGFVKYVDDKISGLTEYTPFLRPSVHSYQNEFRATFIDMFAPPDQPVTITTGSLRDIAVPLYEDGVEELYMEDGRLLYPTYTANEDVV